MSLQPKTQAAQRMLDALSLIADIQQRYAQDSEAHAYALGVVQNVQRYLERSLWHVEYEAAEAERNRRAGAAS